MMNEIHRRDFIHSVSRGVGAGALAYWASGCEPGGRTIKQVRKKENVKHIVTLSFDDGFRKSSIKTAEIYEKYNLSACINVIATGHRKSFAIPDKYQADVSKGDFGLWNELQERGHEIMPHGYKHANLRQMELTRAQDLILRCLDIFTEELDGFEAKRSVFNFPYNASSAELEKWLTTQVRAFRTGGGALNPLPHQGQVKLTCISHGPGNIDAHLEKTVNALLEQESGWLIYNTHGLDGEGWGPMSTHYLETLLARLVEMETVAILPVGPALNEFIKT